MKSIEIKQLSFRYGSKQALKDVSFSLSSGKFTALLGPNGAGKSTLYALLTRIYGIQQGEITILDQDLRHHPKQVMASLGVVFQQSTLDLDLTVLQNLLYHGSLHGLSKQQTTQRAQKELARMSMSEHLHRKIRSLNGGHRRRVEIARALLHQPKILLLDEATVGLDPRTRKSINQHVRRLCDEDGLTVLWATHLIEEIDLNDPVVILHRGQVEQDADGASICQQLGTETLADAFERITECEAVS